MAATNENSPSEIDSEELPFFKILVLGDSGVGKTGLIKTYLSNVDIGIKELDIFVMYAFLMSYKGKKADVGLIDLYPGANSVDRRECYPTDVDVIILCYSIGHYFTLKGVYNLWIHEVRAHYGNSIPVFLVGLKSDFRLIDPATIPYDALRKGDNRLVEKSEAEAIHKKYNFYGDYMECTVQDQKSINNVIQNAFVAAFEEFHKTHSNLVKVGDVVSDLVERFL